MSWRTRKPCVVVSKSGHRDQSTDCVIRGLARLLRHHAFGVFYSPLCHPAGQPALEELRRAEVRAEPAMKRSRWMWLKDKKKWTKKQIAQHHTLSRMQLKTGRAFRLKEALREIFALTLKSHWDGILNGFDSALNNGSVEAINGLIQAAKARARGYRKPRNLMLMAYLIAAKLSHLPTSPYTTTYGDIIK